MNIRAILELFVLTGYVLSRYVILYELNASVLAALVPRGIASLIAKLTIFESACVVDVICTSRVGTGFMHGL